MTLILKDRVKETTTTVGLGTISLGGSSDTFEPFSTIGTGNTTYYAIVAEGNDNWEVGVGTVGSGTLSRDIVLASSNLNAKVNFPAGTKDVFVTLPANKIVSKDDATGINSGISLADYVDFDTAAAPATAVGRLFWNDQDGTLDLGLKGGSVTIHIGQKQVIRIVNKIGSSLSAANYQCVKISGAQGQRPKVALAQANNDANSADTIGLVNETIANNQEGFVCTGGTITNINTTGSLQGESWNDGDVLYLSGTVAGRLTNVKPQAPIHTVIVGFVIYAHANQGKIFVKVDNGYELNELHNVNINGVTNGQVLTYNNGLWENQTNGSGTVTSVSGTGGYGGLTLTGTVTSSGNLTLGGTPTGTWPVSVSGNAATVTNGVYTTGDQTIGGNKNFSSTIIGSVSGNAGTVTNGVYTTGDQTIDGAKTFTAITAPTLAVGTNNTSVATTAFVNAEIANDAPSKTGTGASGTWGISVTGNAGTVDNGVYTTGNQTIVGTKTFSSDVILSGIAANSVLYLTASKYVTGGATLSFDGSTLNVMGTVQATSFVGALTGNASTVTNGVYTTGDQTIGGTKTFSSTISGSVSGNAGTVTNGVYTTGDQTIGGTKTFSSTITGSITGNAGTVTNGVYTTGDQTIAGIKTFSGASTIVNGNLGIGTTSVGQKLLVRQDQNDSTRIAVSNQDSGSSADSGIRLSSFGGSWDIANGSSAKNTNALTFGQVGGSERMRIQSNGAVLIGAGATASLGKLVVSEASSGTAIIALESQGSWNSTIACTSTGNLVLRNNGASDRMVFDPYGNIITYGPMYASIYYDNNNSAYYLDPANSGTSMVVAGDVVASNLKTSANTALSLGLYTGTAFNTGGAAISLRGSTTGYNDSGMEFYAGNSERMRIASNGSVGIARVPDTSFALDVGGEVRIINAVGGGFGGAFRLYNSSAGATNPAKHFRIGSTGHLEIINSAYNAVPFVFTDSGSFYASSEVHSPVFVDYNNSAFYLNPNDTGTSLNVAGSIVAGGNVTAYSDIRVKDNVENITGAIGKLNQIRGVTYTRTDLDDKQRRFAGVIAQEIEQVLPEAVFDNGKVKAVDYNATIALLIEAVKEQQGQINELKLTIEQLKGN